jgi:hypothetical protein
VHRARGRCTVCPLGTSDLRRSCLRHFQRLRPPLCLEVQGCRCPNDATPKGFSRNPRARQEAFRYAPGLRLQQLRRSLPFCSPVVLLDVTHLILPHTSLCIIMLRNTLRQCSRQLQSCSAKARLSTIAASPARTNAISSCRRPLAVAQRRSYALAAEDTDKGVVRRRTRTAPAAEVSSLPLTMTA